MRRARPAARFRRGARAPRAPGASARRDFPLRRGSEARLRTPARAEPGAGSLRAREGGVLGAGGRSLPGARARTSTPLPRDGRLRRPEAGARPPRSGLRAGLRLKPFPWHREELRRLLARRESMTHALLVHGRAGIGKVEFGRVLAASVLCEPRRAGLACESCPACHWFSQGNHPDFREIVPEAALEDEESADEPAKPEKAKSLVIKIDQIRAVADFIALTTHRAGYRVMLIHPAEALQPAAANALLKTLEEPPPHTLIVMVSDRPARLLATLRSRCRPLGLATPPREEALEWLRSQEVAEPLLMAYNRATSGSRP